MKTHVFPPWPWRQYLAVLVFVFIYAQSMSQWRSEEDYLFSGTPVYQGKPETHLFITKDIAANMVKTSGSHAPLNNETEEYPKIKNGDASAEFPGIIRVNGYRGIPSGLKSGNFSVHFKPSSFIYPHSQNREVGLSCFEISRLRLYAQLLKQYAVSNHFDTNYAFLANMGVLSTRKRFFVINLRSMEVEQSGLVSHGRGPGMSIYDRSYSNDPDSKCTSLGRYKVMSTYRGAFGLSYRIAGLDSSNSNAVKRKIVLHSMHCIPDIESIMPACVSEGCPAVSEHFFSSIRKLIDTRKKPMLLWIIDSNLELPEIIELPEAAPEAPKTIHQETVKTVQVKKRSFSPVKHSIKKVSYAGLISGASDPAIPVNQVKQINELLGFKK